VRNVQGVAAWVKLCAMHEPLTRRALWLALVGLLGGCGSTAGDEPGTASPAAPQEAPEAPSAPPSPPPEVRLAWLPDGQLSLENTGDATVSLQRLLGVPSELSGLGPLTLEVECSAAPSSAPCISLVPGAAVALGRWPDERGTCRCPPCAAVGPDAAVSLMVRSCDTQHELPQTLPPR
jgi:hypothetical protein